MPTSREELDASTREAKQQLVLISNLSAEKEASAQAAGRMAEHIASLRADLSREQSLTSNLQALLLSRDTALSENKQQGSEVSFYFIYFFSLVSGLVIATILPGDLFV